jgi:hypothetical protein
MLNYLFHFALPWLYLRRAVRGNESDPIDLMWELTLPWFRATNKYLYANMCVDVTWAFQAMSHPIRSIWRRHRTMSLSGNRGRNIAHDKNNEHMNNEVKTGLGAEVTRENIDPFILRLLGINAVAPALRRLLGIGSNDADDGAAPRMDMPEYPGVLQSDVDHIVAKLKLKLGSSYVQLQATKSSVFARGSSGNPMTRVHDKATDIQDYVTAHYDRVEA